MNNPSLPTGTVTFLFTDIEGSTKLAREHPETWETARARHHTILREAIEANNGYVFQIIGDAFCAAFHKAGDALKATIKSQQELQNEKWGEATIRVRMGIHTGEAETHNNEYRGYLTLSLVQRVMSAGHGGQILLSNATENLLRDQLAKDMALRDMGEHKFKDVSHPVRVFQVSAPDLQSEFPALRTLSVFPNNLPTQITSFVGREKELTDVKKLLRDAHMLTLIGPGGTGKTRLSIQAAQESLDQYPDGVWLVELAPILDPLLVPRTTAIAIGLRDEPQRPVIDMLCDYLREKKMLILLDNCEHLVDACAQMADRLLHASAHTRILASSREALGIAGEVTYRVPSLGLPDMGHLPSFESLSQYEAVKLFIDRATSAVSTFTVTNDNAPSLAQICHRLDGIPLAIELAAAKIRVLSVEQIAKRLDDRFRLLTGGSRTALEHHQTLRAAIDWSYILLPPAEQVLFRRLSIFVGGWTLEAAESVCGDPSTPLGSTSSVVRSDDVLNLMEQLINKSLVIAEEAGHESRYRMLETMRQYAREKLLESGESEKIRDHHLKAFVDLAEQAEPEIRSANQLIWLDRLDEEIDNLRAALKWSQERDLESCLRLTGALWRFWDLRGYLADALEWYAQSIRLSNGMRTIPRARLLSRASVFYRNVARNNKLLQLAQEASTLARELNDKVSLVLAMGIEGEAVLNQPEIAQPLLEEALRISEELDDHWLVSMNLYDLANLANRRGDYELQRSCLEKGLEQGRLSGDHRRVSLGLAYLASYYLDRGKFSQAEEILREGLALATQIGDKSNVAERSLNLANVNIFLEKYSEAEALLVESRKGFEEIGDNFYLVFALCGLGYLAWVKDNLEQFDELSGKALEIAKQVDSLYALAPTLYHHGIASLVNHEHRLAREELTESIHVCQKLNMKRYYGACIAGFGMLATAEWQLERAAQIFGAFQQLAPSLPPETPFLVRKIDEQMELVRNKLGIELFEASASKGKGMSLEQVLVFVLDESHE